jgi:hypothetical protein
MKKELKQALLASKAALCLLWPVSAWAATITFGEQMAAIPMLSVLMTMLLSTLMGATALLHAMKQEYEKAAVIQRLALFVAYHLLSSNAAGLLMFFGAESWDIQTGYRAGAIMLAAFGGNQAIARAYQFFQNKYAPEPAK